MRLRSFALCLVYASLWSSVAYAWPTLSARPIDNAIAGPADPHVAGIFYNPAAIGPLRGVHIWYETGAGVQLGDIQRNAGPGAQAGQSTPITNPSLDGFFGVTWDLFTDRIVLGVGVTSPFNELTTFPKNSAVRYQDIWQRSATLEELIGVGIRISSRFHIGATANFTESWMDYRFARDVAPNGGSAYVSQPNALCGGKACGFENPLATQDVRVRGFGWGLGFSVGALVRPIDRLWLGLSYVSHIFDPFGGVDMPLNSDNGVSVKQAPGAPDPGCGGACTGRARITTLIPDIIMFGLRVEATPRFEIEGQFRWTHYGSRNALDIYMQGGDLYRLGASEAVSALPSQLRLDRGWRDAFLFGGSLRVKLSEKLRLSPSIFYESTPADLSYVSAANLVGHSLDFALTAEYRPRTHLIIGAHVGGTVWLDGQAGGAFDPQAQVNCVDSQYALSACQKSINGAALSSAAGRYTMGAIHAGFAVGMEY